MKETLSMPRLGCLLMAAGNARRFGENKLLAELEGKTLIRRALEAVPLEEFTAAAVVTQYDEIMALAREVGFHPIYNDHPEWGISYTIRLGTGYLAPMCDAICYQVADQPLLTRESCRRELALYCEHPKHIVALSHNGVRGNPCIFPARFFPELLALTGDQGGSRVIRAHEEALLLCEADRGELLDADTPEALKEIRERGTAASR